MEQFPLISVIVPVYKAETYLDRCVRSIAEQTYSNLEILLVDDGSPDRSGAMCDAWAEKDSRIKVIHKENDGAGMARNTGLDAAKGELIGFVDSDDYLAPQMYAHLYSLMEDGVDIAECEIGMTEGDDFSMDDGSQGEVTVCSMAEAMALHIQDRLFCQTPPNKLYRRSVTQGVRFPRRTLIDDEFFTYRLIGNARKLAHSTCCMYAYRQQAASAMHRPYSLGRLDGIRAKRERLRYLQERLPQLTDAAKYDLFFTCLYSMQETLRHLTGEEKEAARKILHETLEELKPLPVSGQLSKGKNLLLVLGKCSLETAAAGLNFLQDIHVLT